MQGLSGVSDDGSYVYFVAEGDLSGAQANTHGDRAQSGRPNLYLHHAGAITFIATLDAVGEDTQRGANEGDTCAWDSYSNPGFFNSTTQQHTGNCMSARVSADGSYLAFNSLRSLTGYDNVVPGTSVRDHEIFLYHATDDTLSCASCDPTNAPPTDDPTFGQDASILNPMSETIGFAHFTPTYLTRQLDDAGQVFFQTANRLVPADENSQRDVYEYHEGRLSLISSGKSSEESQFKDASANGSDVFFITTDALVGGDADNTLSLYDARVGGVAEPPPPSACEGETACRGSTSAPPLSSPPPSATFVGHEAPPPPPSSPPPSHKKHCKKGFKKVRVHGRLVCKRVHKHKAKRGARR